ncbi:MAG: N-acetyltransferase [Methylobacterium sp.]|uniref:GNAT family N-acetyltransferase n=1 Tax=Methylobacterium sp. TaxID=409 RepID=UPI0025E642E1|nr:hypothetical protein [Methylobacterium sp.]MBX9934144.1 N-acetyltransferase [Methylobacterium sp.]
MRGNYFFLDREQGQTANVIVTVGPSEKHALVSQMFTPTALRGRGIQKRLLEQVCADADAEGMTLHLQPQPDSEGALQDHATSDQSKLVDLFRSFDFEFAEGNPAAMMVRPPKA